MQIVFEVLALRKSIKVIHGFYWGTLFLFLYYIPMQKGLVFKLLPTVGNPYKNSK